jgi:ferredoxin
MTRRHTDQAKHGRARLAVDWTRCEAHGVCLELLPEVLRPDDWGYPTVTGPVADGLRGIAERARAACPTAALRLDDAD